MDSFTPGRADSARTSRFARWQRFGAVSWAAVGVILLVLLIACGVSALSGVLAPLLIAMVLGSVFEPMVRALRRAGLPASAAAAVGVLSVILLTLALGAVVFVGVTQQLPEISQQLAEGSRRLLQMLRTSDLDVSWADGLRENVNRSLPQLGFGLLGAFTSAFSGIVSFAISAFLSVFFLFFTLRDAEAFPAWLARTTPLDARRVAEFDALARRTLRQYFKGVAVTALITAPIFVVPLLLLRVPLLLPIVITYFALSFIPYVGAWITGAFAVLVAYGSGGTLPAVVVAASLAVSNGTIQTVVNSWALGSTLQLHPVSVLLATLIGGAISGVLGMVLGPPLLSIAQQTATRARAVEESAETGAKPPEPG